MALSNGLMTGAQAQKLNAYPAVNNNANQVLKGDGKWGELTMTSATVASGVQLKWGSGTAACTIPFSSFATETLTYSADANGNLVYKRANGTVAFTIPLASGS